MPVGPVRCTLGHPFGGLCFDGFLCAVAFCLSLMFSSSQSSYS